MTSQFLFVFLISVLSSQNDTNLATNTNILLLLLLGLAGVDNNNGNIFGNNTNGCGCFRNLNGFNNFV